MKNKHLVCNIPYGEYCYIIDSIDYNKGFPTIHTKLCPYFKVVKMNGVNVYWCEFCQACSVNYDKISKRSYNKKIKSLYLYFRSKKKAEDSLRNGFLLFDQCKVCGENLTKEEDLI